MPAQLVENIQYFDKGGLPLVGGQIFIGTVGLEPIGNLITIFADEDQTITLPNPQTIGSDGFSENKIYIPGKYSLRVNTVLGAQFLLDQNVGASPGTGTTSLTSVLGTNAITAEGEASVITELVDKEVYTLKIANTNDGTSGVTLQIDATPVKSIVKNFDQPIDPGDFTQDQIIRVAFNETSDNYAWVDASVKTKRQTKGSDISSASSITILNNDGNFFNITGSDTIATINGVAGNLFTFQLDAAPLFTQSSGLQLPGSVNFQGQAGDIIKGFQLTASTVIITDLPGPVVLDRDVSQVIVTNTTVETSLFSFTVPAEVLGTNRFISIKMSGGYINSSGGTRNTVIRLKYGSTTVATNTRSNAGTAGLETWTLDMVLAANGTGAQKGAFSLTSGNNDANPDFASNGKGTSSEDSTGALTLDVTVQFNFVSAGLRFEKETAIAILQ